MKIDSGRYIERIHRQIKNGKKENTVKDARQQREKNKYAITVHCTYSIHIVHRTWVNTSSRREGGYWSSVAVEKHVGAVEVQAGAMDQARTGYRYTVYCTCSLEK